MNNYYVYQYINPLTKQPYYIGKGKDNRCYIHLNLKSTFNKRFNGYNKKLISQGIQPIIIKIKENMTEKDAYNLEEKLIKKYGRKGIDDNGILLNILQESKAPNRQGKKHKQKSIIKMRRQRQNINAHFYGKKHTNETKEKIRQYNLGRHHKKESKNKLSKEWLIITPSNENIHIKNLNDYCKKNRLHSSNMYDIAKGKRKQHKGYKCYFI